MKLMQILYFYQLNLWTVCIFDVTSLSQELGSLFFETRSVATKMMCRVFVRKTIQEGSDKTCLISR